MSRALADALEQLLRLEVPHLRGYSEERAAIRPRGEGSWSPKEELGHLLDSAVNNHARFVRTSLEASYHGVPYDQEGWVRIGGYQDLPWSTLIDLWELYNGLLAHVIRRIPEHRLETTCHVGDSPAVTLRFLIEDYIAHMQHHLDHILGRRKSRNIPARRWAFDYQSVGL